MSAHSKQHFARGQQAPKLDSSAGLALTTGHFDQAVEGWAPIGTLPDELLPEGASRPKLFDSLVQLHNSGGLALKNRVVVSPMCQYVAKDGFPSVYHLGHHASWALHGVGTIMFETAGVTPAGRISTHDLGLWKDEQVPAFISLVSSLRALSPGLTVGMQLGHAGRKSSTFPPFQRLPRKHEHWAEEEEGGWPKDIVAPSAVPYGPGWFKPRELTIQEIEDIKQRFVDAAERAFDKVGVDFIEIHLAHGYLGHQFISPLSNKRTDEYGGSFEGRTKFPLDIVKAIRARWPERSLWVRLSATDQCDHLAAQGIETWDLEQSKRLARILDDLGVAVLDVSSGGLVAEQQIQVGHAYQAPLAAGIKSLDLPTLKVMSVGMLESGADDKAGQVAEETLQKGYADLIAIARGQMASPQWTELAAANLAGVRTVENPSYHRMHGPKRVPH